MALSRGTLGALLTSIVCSHRSCKVAPSNSRPRCRVQSHGSVMDRTLGYKLQASLFGKARDGFSWVARFLCLGHAQVKLELVPRLEVAQAESQETGPGLPLQSDPFLPTLIALKSRSLGLLARGRRRRCGPVRQGRRSEKVLRVAANWDLGFFTAVRFGSATVMDLCSDSWSLYGASSYGHAFCVNSSWVHRLRSEWFGHRSLNLQIVSGLGFSKDTMILVSWLICEVAARRHHHQQLHR